MYAIDLAKKGILLLTVRHINLRTVSRTRREKPKCISVSEVPAYVLIDSGATHSFISTAFIAKSCIAYEKLECSRSNSDVILGMDWLWRDHATIRYFENEVEKMLKKKSCHGFLVNISGAQQSKVPLPVVPIVRDFIDVFPNDLLGTPLDRQVEFTIDLVPRAGLVSKAPYRMVSKEIQELKIQIQELLDRGFI
ncbi:uncharacterized protein LOC111376126 [Olea europaea var. sylvestris]|uniref:uncharacterized protein LOC111376126 n=1 Tax=Olea europaea var. sylvestris TaxID=158386 RepID=UPI000C1D4E23|nr:uncharacterized protein LOC111376126 [Olea europaea var. sylvestris]